MAALAALGTAERLAVMGALLVYVPALAVLRRLHDPSDGRAPDHGEQPEDFRDAA